MHPQLDARYEGIRSLKHSGERLIGEARDRLTGRRVILKTDTLPRAQRELSTLLAIPPGLGPAVLDAVWTPGERLLLILELLPGKTLQEAAPGITRHQLPGLVHSICQCLGHLHRAGFVHADLKPSNLLLLDDGNGTTVRLLDFGFALSRLADPSEELGGTHPFMAPEFMSRWVVDGRADQFSLGMILDKLYPDLHRDPQWGSILERLCARIPAHRYPHILAVRDELAQLFGLPDSPARFPPFGGGPMRGRDALLEQIVSRVEAHPTARILLQARRGTGLTRFMVETLLAIATYHGPPTRLVEVAFLERKAFAGEKIAEFLQDRSGAKEAILCGMPDPSPGFGWLGSTLVGSLRETLSGPGWERTILPPLDTESFVEIVAGSLESEEDLTEELANRLHGETDGDLRCSAEGFSSFIRQSGIEVELSWKISPDLSRRQLATWSPPLPEPSLSSVPEELCLPLQICARAGRSLPKSTAEELLRRFGPSHSFDQLLDYACLQPDGVSGVRFVTGRLWREAASKDCDQSEQIDSWLNAHVIPDADHPDEIILACQRARRIGDREKESGYLTDALQRAHSERRWNCVRQLLAYPGPIPGTWTVEEVLRQADMLKEILGPDWNEQRIVLVAAESIYQVSAAVAVSLFERVAKSDDADAAAKALIQLLDRAIHRSDAKSYADYMGALRQQESMGQGIPQGVLDFFRARRALGSGKAEEAESFAGQAAECLWGSGTLYESLNMQLLAVLRFSRDPQRGIEAMQSALECAQDREQEAQMRTNLALMCSQSGDIEAAARCADDGLKALQGHVSQVRLAGLRIQRAWAWAELDLAEQAMKEARDLLNLAAVRQYRSHYANVRLLLGYCQLHRSSEESAIAHTARAWEEVNKGHLPTLRAESLRYLIDVLLDLEAWDTVRAYAKTIQLDTGCSDDAELTTSARAKALRAQAEGKLAEAADRLAEHLERARHLSSKLGSARYLHHMGIVGLAQADVTIDPAPARKARDLFQEELAILDGPAYGYYRGRALLALSVALSNIEDYRGASATLDQAVALTRRIQSRGLLVKCLKTKMQLRTQGGLV